MRRQRLTAVASLAMLQIFTVAAGLSLVTMGVSAPEETAEPVLWPTVTGGRPVLTAATTDSTARAGQVAAVLEEPLDSRSLGGSVAAAVADPAAGELLYSQRADVPVTPASTTKIATGVAAVASLGPDHRITTRVVRPSGASPDGGGPGATSPPSPPGASDQPIILVGGGDPTLASPAGAATAGYPRPAELADLARSTVRALTKAGITATRVAYDDSLFTGPRTGPGWGSNYVPEGNVAPVTALSVDEGRIDPSGRSRVLDPPQAAAEMFADLLEGQGITVRGPVVREPAPARAAELAAVRSPPVSALVEHMLDESDNDLAEALARQVAIKEGRPASFEGAAAAVRGVLTELGVATGVDLADGSGLSTRNQLTAAALTRLLSLAASPDRPEMRPVVTGLPVAGFSGTLANRYDEYGVRSGAGVVRAKTGTLSGVSSLAGVVYADDGQLLVFAFLADDVPVGGTYRAEDALDELATALAECGCR